MEKWYPYRFKTKQEFIDSFGQNWRNANGESLISFVEQMDYLLGKNYPFEIYLDSYDNHSYLPNSNDLLNSNSGGNWIICKFMLIKNKPPIPNYKPKSKIERTL